MRRVLILVIPLALSAAPAAAQIITRGGLSGKIQTFRAIVGPAPVPPVTMVTTPPARSGVFILTEACANNASGSILDTGNPALTIVSSSGDPFKGNARCVTYTPGLAIPPSTAITCNNADTGNGNTCLITGVLSRH